MKKFWNFAIKAGNIFFGASAFVSGFSFFILLVVTPIHMLTTIVFDLPILTTNYGYKIFWILIFSSGAMLALSVNAISYLEKFTKHRHKDRETLQEWKGTGGVLISNKNNTFAVTLDDEVKLKDWLQNTLSAYVEIKALCNEEAWSEYIDKQIFFFDGALQDCSDIKGSIFDRQIRAHSGFEHTSINVLGSEIEANRILLPESPIGSYVFDVKKAPLKRLYAFAYLSDIDFSNVEIEVKRPEGSTPIEFSEALKFWVEDEGVRAGGPAGGSWAASEGPKVVAELAISTLNYAGKLKVREQEFETLHARLITTLEQAERKLALKPAAKEWSSAALKSLFLAGGGLTLFLSAFGLLMWGIYVLGAQLMPIIEDQQRLNTYFETFEKAPIWSAAFITVPAILLAWLMKHFSRMFVQGFNMYSDARYRKALTQIYSEIGTRDGHELTPDQKRIIFEAMFNPRKVTHTDDSISPTPIDSIFKWGKS